MHTHNYELWVCYCFFQIPSFVQTEEFGKNICLTSKTYNEIMEIKYPKLGKSIENSICFGKREIIKKNVY